MFACFSLIFLFCSKWRTEASRRTNPKFLFPGFQVTSSEIPFNRFLKEVMSCACSALHRFTQDSGEQV